MKRNMLFLMLGICTVTVMAAACGKNPAVNTVTSGGAISGGVVSSGVVDDRSASGDVINGIAVSESSIQAEEAKPESHKGTLANIKKSRYANNRNIYEGNGDVIYQYDLNGEQEHYYNMKNVIGKHICPEVLWVEDEWLFISCYVESERCEIRRIPISKTKSKKRLCVDKWEKLAETEDIVRLITKTDQEIFYCAGERIYRVNLKTKEEQGLATGISECNCRVVEDSNGIPLVQDGMAYIKDIKKGKMYQLDLAKWKLRDFGADSDGKIGTDATHFYYMTDDGMVKYNTKTGKKKTLFTREELENQIVSTQFPEKENITVYEDQVVHSYVTSVYYYQDCLYIAMEVYLKGVGNEEEIDDEDYYDGGWVRFLFSCSASDGSNLKHEKVATEYLWQHSIPFESLYLYLQDESSYSENENEYENEYILEKTGQFVYLMDGGILMRLYDYIYGAGAIFRFVLYDPDKGTFQKVQRNSEEYGQLKALGCTSRGYTLYESTVYYWE